MALEPIGNSVAVDKLKKRLKKKYPNHNFDVKQQPDTRCKAPSLCKSNKIFYLSNVVHGICFNITSLWMAKGDYIYIPLDFLEY